MCGLNIYSGCIITLTQHKVCLKASDRPKIPERKRKSYCFIFALRFGYRSVQQIRNLTEGTRVIILSNWNRIWIRRRVGSDKKRKSDNNIFGFRKACIFHTHQRGINLSRVASTEGILIQFIFSSQKCTLSVCLSVRLFVCLCYYTPSSFFVEGGKSIHE